MAVLGRARQSEERRNRFLPIQIIEILCASHHTF
jgi:hypothetical protein